MHKRILLCLDREQFEPFNYDLNYKKAMTSLGWNSGNNVFQFALEKLLTNKYNQTSVDTNFLHVNEPYFNETIEYVNSNYDCLVFSPANLISQFANVKILETLTERINKIKIPVYAIGLGAQSDREYSLDFIQGIRSNAFSFLKAILKTGGRLGLRGYFSADAVKKLGFTASDYSVIGCPSLFMKGANLKIIKKDISEKELRLAVNGFRAWYSPDIQAYFKSFPKSLFVCQEEFYKLLYNFQDFDWKEYQYLADSNHKFYDMYKDAQIKLYCDFQSWYNDIISKGINFSFGCRIHGNIVPILAGIPAYIDMFDSRVRELGEYFEIPGSFLHTGWQRPYELYLNADYTKFNKNFLDKYRRFENFMSSCDLSIDTSTSIPNEYVLPSITNQQYISEVSAILQKPRKIVFVAHEFGLFKGHGGIASYLYNICSWLLKLPTVEVFILTHEYDRNCDLLQNSRFNLYKLHGSLDNKRIQVDEYINKIAPDYVEFAEYLALGLTCLKNRAGNKNLSNTVFVTNNHTATRECYEWSNFENIEKAPLCLQNIYKEESEQMHLSDYNIAPSSFLAKYVKDNYHLKDEVLVFGNPYMNVLETKQNILKKLEKTMNLDLYKNSFNIVLISRFEGRKQQDKLVNAVINLKRKGYQINLFLAGNTSGGKNYEDFRYEIYKTLKNTDGIYFYDFLNIEQQESLISIADLTIMASKYENQPISMIEMILCGVPVMASKYSGIVDYTKDNELLFDPFIPDDLEKHLEDYINLDKNVQENLTNNQYDNLMKFIAPQKTIYERITLPVKKEVCK